jgi:hypothetical protein
VTETHLWFRLTISALAAWRLTHLLAAEDGPWDLIVRIRLRLGTSIWGHLMDCFNCLSLWISVPLAFFVADGMLTRFVSWLALSGAACLAEQLSTGQSAKPPIFFESVAQQENK